ncbi:hypothetical protein Cadr_000015257 [Camelus dromedarius]|uniref:Uncharacterized protein n=1 Tax=Camelus dromedarius TaxID=9838 RepID=A0A5N4DMW0_CAMDR|nr:hypothetical protein Cadr_000015257 [Camelus dromedarius]
MGQDRRQLCICGRQHSVKTSFAAARGIQVRCLEELPARDTAGDRPPMPCPLTHNNSLVWAVLVIYSVNKPVLIPALEQTGTDIQTTQVDHCQGPGTPQAGKLVRELAGHVMPSGKVFKAGELRVTSVLRLETESNSALGGQGEERGRPEAVLGSLLSILGGGSTGGLGLCGDPSGSIMENELRGLDQMRKAEFSTRGRGLHRYNKGRESRWETLLCPEWARSQQRPGIALSPPAAYLFQWEPLPPWQEDTCTGGRGADSAKGPPRPPLELGSGSANGQEEGVSFLTGSPPSFPTNTMWTCNRGKEEWISLGNQGGLPGGSSLWDGLQGVIGCRELRINCCNKAKPPLAFGNPRTPPSFSLNGTEGAWYSHATLRGNGYALVHDSVTTLSFCLGSVDGAGDDGHQQEAVDSHHPVALAQPSVGRWDNPF